MVYFKMLLNDKRPKLDNIYPIEVRVTYHRTNTSFATGIRVNKNQWDGISFKVKHTHAYAQVLNKTILDFYNKIQNVSLKLVEENLFSFELLKERINVTYQVAKAPEIVTFKCFAEQLIKDMFEANEAGNAIIYRTATNRLLGYASNATLRFDEITFTLLEGFQRSLTKENIKKNSISNYFRTLRAIYNKAIKAKVVDRGHYPFLDISVKTERTAKRALRIVDLKAIAGLELQQNTQMAKARDTFLLSFALRGVSFTDLAYLKHSNIIKGRVVYKRQKTGQELSIRIQDNLKQLMKTMPYSHTEYLLPVLPTGSEHGSKQCKNLIAQWIKTSNKYLGRIADQCKIDTEVTTYVTRHSWATTAKRLGYSNEMIAEGMGHEYGNKITNIYLDDFDQNLIDEMNNAVIESVISRSRIFTSSG